MILLKTLKDILFDLKEMKADLISNIEYEKEKENHEMIVLLQSELIKVTNAIYALEN